jgi:DNA-binding MarR family transcriptional regulator
VVAPLEHALLRMVAMLSKHSSGNGVTTFRYFVAVAEAGSLTVAAARKLQTSQPSLSRQIRDLEDEVGTALLTRRARGIELTPAGRAFLDQAPALLSQAEAPSEAARRVAHPSKPCFAMGFLSGPELTVVRGGKPSISGRTEFWRDWGSGSRLGPSGATCRPIQARGAELPLSDG